MATDDITISASNSAQHEQQQSDSVRFAIAAIAFASGGIPTIHIENENTGEIAAMTPESAAMDCQTACKTFQIWGGNSVQ